MSTTSRGWPETARQTVEWHPDRGTALAVEKAAIKAEGPRYNKIHAVKPPKSPRLVRPKPVMTPSPGRYMSTTQVAAMARTSRHTVEREIDRGNLVAEKIGRLWVATDVDADRWAAQFKPYAAQRKQGTQPAAD
jgi:hypothetical protein